MAKTNNRLSLLNTRSFIFFQPLKLNHFNLHLIFMLSKQNMKKIVHRSSFLHACKHVCFVLFMRVETNDIFSSKNVRNNGTLHEKGSRICVLLL